VILRIVLFLSVVLPGSEVRSAEEFAYSVKHHHALKDCRGVLKINSDGIMYMARKGKDIRKWTFEDIRTLEIVSPTKISIVTYEDQKRWLGKDKVFEFDLGDKKATPELSALLLNYVQRPMKLAVIPDIQEKPQYEIPVKHLHAISGTRGMLRIYSDKVVYTTAVAGDSRFWRMRDIERFSRPDRFRFQIVSYLPQTGGPNENYDFQLMQDLPEGVYDYLWVRLHPASYYPSIQH